MQRQFDNLLVGSIELFCLAAELGSFTVAANAASVTPAAVSRAVARLEKRLGARLFVRTTRQIRLTDVGSRYFEQCRLALSHLVDAEREATGQQTTPAGVLRISMPTPYGHYRVLPLLADFHERYPEVTGGTHLSNRNIDFADEPFDLAIRGRAPRDSSLIARKLEDAELVVVALPAYLRKAAKLETPDDLINHNCIQFELPSTGRNLPWVFNRDGDLDEITTRGRHGSSGDALAGVTLARHGGRRVPYLSVHCRERHSGRNAQGNAQAVRRMFATVPPAISARSASVFTCSLFRGFPDEETRRLVAFPRPPLLTKKPWPIDGGIQERAWQGMRTCLPFDLRSRMRHGKADARATHPLSTASRMPD
jgi:DNA-binding transcriptional LysR family regulator